MTYRALTMGVMLLAAVSLPARGQNAPGWDPGAPQATRVELEELMKRLEETSQSTTYSARIRDQAAEQALQVKKRLEEGDMQIGEGLLIEIKEVPHNKLSNSYGITTDREIVVPTVGDVSLKGVLRSELQDHLTAEFAKKIIGFSLSVKVPIRVEVTGAVVRPGTYFVAPEIPLLDAINSANTAQGVREGGMLDDMKLIRGGKVVLDGEEWRLARTENRSLDQLGIRSGDVILVPTKTASGLFANGRRAFGALSGVFSMVILARRMGIL